MDEAQLVAESDKSPGVLLASGYIAGGAIAGIIIAFLAGVLADVDDKLNKWAEASNPFFPGKTSEAHPYADLLSMIPFVVLCVVLYLVGRELLLNGRAVKAAARGARAG